MTTKAESLITHHDVFEEPIDAEKTRADWLLKKYRAKGGLLSALAFDRAAENHQMAALREFGSEGLKELGLL